MSSRPAIAAFVVSVFAAGCAESAWTWTLNPDGSGKVELDARLQPQSDMVGGGTMWDLRDDPDKMAKSVARKILAKSKGVAAWKDVSSGIAEDGRVTFKGTAYFADLGALKIKGEELPVRVLKPSLSRRHDGLLVLGVRPGNTTKASAGDGGERGRPLVEPTEEKAALAVKKGKVAYQTERAMLAAYLSTMRAEIILRPPGEVTEASGFSRLDDGRLRLLFDGPTVLRKMDEMVEQDAARMPELLDEIDRLHTLDLEVLSRLNEIVFDKREPVRAVVRPGAEPLFDYARELAEARIDEERITDGLGAEAYSSDYVYLWNLSGGVVGSARTDSGTGRGWTIMAGSSDWEASGLGSYGYFEVSHVSYDEDALHPEVKRVIFSGGMAERWSRFGGGFGICFGKGDIWAMGPHVSCGFGLFGRRAEFYLAASGFLWVGERDDAFDVDLEADVRLVTGLRF